MTAKQFATMIGAEYRVSWDDLVGPSRKPAVVVARHEAMWSLRQITRDGKPRYSLTFLGRMFNRHHTSVLWACEAYERKHVLRAVAA